MAFGEVIHVRYNDLILALRAEVLNDMIELKFRLPWMEIVKS